MITGVWKYRGKSRDVHHIIRRVDGGGDEIDNLMMLHPNCHRLLHSH
ncbi:HNH endonuclease [Klebsiella pneumoniae]